VATRTEFGVDIGGAATVAKLRALWQSLRESREALFEGLHPVIAVRESTRSGAVDLRLVVGPVIDAQAAARLCATLSAAGLSCQTTVFDGQRLALK
jgi:phosphoribulokinase